MLSRLYNYIDLSEYGPARDVEKVQVVSLAFHLSVAEAAVHGRHFGFVMRPAKPATLYERNAGSSKPTKHTTTTV